MKIFVFLGSLLLLSCSNPFKLAVPNAFKEQATELHVMGTKKRQMKFGDFNTSKIRRGKQVSYPGSGRGFDMENLLLNFVGLQKTELVYNEKASFRYSLSHGATTAEVMGKEKEVTRSIEYKLKNSRSLFNSYEQTQEYKYIFSALINLNGVPGNNTWELLMTNLYEREKDPNPKILTIIKPGDNGIVTNGTDSFFIKTVILRETETASGKKGKFPFDMLGGYEVRTTDGVAAIIDVAGSNIWFYNELQSTDRLLISAIGTAIFARRLKDVTWGR